MPESDRPVPASAAPPARAPMMRGSPIIGVAWQMRQRPLPTLLKAFTDYPNEEAAFMKLGPYRATLFRHPDLIKRIFVDNVANYGKQTRGYIKSRIVLGDGLVTSEGELWQRQRRIATPAFHRQRVAGFAQTFATAGEALVDQWQQRVLGRGGNVVDVYLEFMRLTLRIALQTLLGTSAEDELDRLSPAVTECLERTNDIITNPIALPEWVPTPKHRRFKRAIDTLDQFVYATIARRRKEQAAGQMADDLLSMLLAARDEETGQGMTDRLLRDEAVTILIAGHETTAIALTWAVHLLSLNPDCREELERELETVLSGRLPTAADYPQLRYTKAVIEEAMRLYPPAWMIGRSAKQDDTLGRYTIRAGEFALVSPFVTHRHPGLWEEPDKFDPTRFLDGRAERLPKFSYIPFGGGPRFCIGATFAMMEAVLLLATIARRVRLQHIPEHKVEPWAMITMRPRDGLQVSLRFR